MKKMLIGLFALTLLSACQTTGSLRNGEVYGTDIGAVLTEESGLSLSNANVQKMNSEIEKALFFSEDGLTTNWYAGVNARIRPTDDIRNRADRTCRRFRHSVMIENDWLNGTAVACREYNVAWYLISNRWDRTPNNRQDDRRTTRPNRGRWENLSDDLRGNPAGRSNDDFGPRAKTPSW